jgi:mono/diheme cytochrome c family protein
MNRIAMRGIQAVILVFALVFVFGAAAHAQGNGAKLYTANKCDSCHGADGSAGTPAGKALGARDFHSPEVQGQSDAELTAEIASGKNKMPAYGKQLKAQEIADLVAYTRALGKK